MATRVIWRQEICRRGVVTVKHRPARLISRGTWWSHIAVQKRGDPTRDVIRRVKNETLTVLPD